MLTAIILLIVTAVSFVCFDYKEEMKLVLLVVWIAFLSMGIHHVAAYVFYDSFLKEIICEYLLVEILVLITGILCGWFVKSNWWMSFVYVTPVFIIAYFTGILRIKKDITSINQVLDEKRKSVSSNQ